MSDLQLPPVLYDALLLAITQGVLPDFEPRVPAMSFFADYGFLPAPALVAGGGHPLPITRWLGLIVG